MKHKIFASLMFVILLTGIAPRLSAQRTKPFTAGEILTYEGKVSRIIQGIAIADLKFSVNSAPNGVDYLMKTNKHDEQKERVRDSEAIFDYESGQVTFVEANPKEPARPPRKIASEIKGEVHDMVSGIYALRMMPLATGKVFEVTVSDSGLVYRVPVRVTRREIQKTVLGKVMCFRVEPEVFGVNRLIEQEGSLVIWITDDARRIPVRAQIKANIGKIEVKLQKAENTTD